MDTYENEYTEENEAVECVQENEFIEENVQEEEENPAQSQPAKPSPFADSPYACAAPRQTVKPAVKKRSGAHAGKVLLVIAMILFACSATALGVGVYWHEQMDAMEDAMEDKFQALEEIYRDTVLNSGENTQVPAEGMTPGQVYSANVQAVVAINSVYESKDGYGEGFGSGFILTENGYVATNYHVVQSATKIFVLTHDEKTYAADLVGYDATNDIALLKIDATGLPHVNVGSSDQLAVGDQVVAIGNPLGELTSTLTVGYISAKDRVIDTDGTVINMLQTDAAINSGNSGGPLFNMRGQVVGITTAKYTGSTTSGAAIEGLGFAIPMDDVMGMFQDLMEYGYVTGAYLGVYVRDVDASAQSYGLPAGAYVEEAMAGMAAERAGILAGDIIVNLGGYDVTSVTELTRVLRKFDAGQTTTITVYRNGQAIYLHITLDEKPAETTPEASEPTQQTPNMPNGGDFEDWFEFFAPFFGQDQG